MKKYVKGKSGKIYCTLGSDYYYSEIRFSDKYVYELIEEFPCDLWGIVDEIIAMADTEEELS